MIDTNLIEQNYSDTVEIFFYDSFLLDILVLKPLSQIKPIWDLNWDSNTKRYIVEEDSYAELINNLITELAYTIPPNNYHEKEDYLATYVLKNLK